MDVAITKVSSKVQIVIPQEIRDEAGFKEGEKLMVYGGKSTVILKKMESPTEEFQKLAAFGEKFAKKNRIKRSDVLLASEKSLAKDWLSKEEDKAWNSL